MGAKLKKMVVDQISILMIWEDIIVIGTIMLLRQRKR